MLPAVDPGGGEPVGGARPDRDSRLKREADFHDRAFAQQTRQATSRFYAVARSSKAAYAARVLEGCGGLSVLEYGCGPGSCGPDLAAAGASVTGIDISPEAIAMAGITAEKRGVSDRLNLQVMDAEGLDLPGAAFDRVCGSGILHHLDLVRAVPEIVRVLKPGGRALFFEPLGHNALINLYRRRTPALRTVDEHPLKMADVRAIARHFGRARLSYHHLTSLLAAPLWGRRGFEPLRAVLEGLDRLLLGLPLIRRQAWIVIMDLSDPLESSP